MRQGIALALVGGAVFIGVAVATLPASLLVSHLPADVAVEGVSGSAWNGAADAIRLRGVPLGAFSWSLEPALLWRGRLGYRVQISRPDGFVRGRVAAGAGGAIAAEDVELELPLTTLAPAAAANAWQGRLQGSVRTALIEGGWPIELIGTFTMSNLRPPGTEINVGAYALEFDGRANTPTQLVGRVRDLAAPLVVRAQLAVRNDHSYVIEGEVTPRPGAAAEISRAVAFLGAPDATGRRAFKIDGTF